MRDNGSAMRTMVPMRTSAGVVLKLAIKKVAIIKSGNKKRAIVKSGRGSCSTSNEPKKEKKS